MGRVSYSLGRDVRHDIIPVALHDHVARSKQLTTTALAQVSPDRASHPFHSLLPERSQDRG